jgi:hypothetical protein
VSEDDHDAAYRGVIDDLSVRVETGVRDSGAYDVIVEVAVDTSLASGIHRREKRDGEDPRARAIVDRLAGIDELLSLRTSPRPTHRPPEAWHRPGGSRRSPRFACTMHSSK